MKIIKPGWLLFAAEARKDLNKVKPSKSGKREEANMLSTYKRACAEFRYRGTVSEWNELLRRLGHNN